MKGINNSVSVQKLIGCRIKASREERKLTRRKLCERLMKSEKAPQEAVPADIDKLENRLKQWEYGNNPISIEWVPAVCEALGCDVGYLFGEYKEKTRADCDICKATGLSEESVEFLRFKKKWESTTEAKVIDLLLTDARKRDEEHDYRPITSLLEFFFKYRDGAGQRKQVFSNGMVVDYNRVDGFISSNSIALDGRIVENAVLMEIEGALKSLKQSIQAEEGK